VDEGEEKQRAMREMILLEELATADVVAAGRVATKTGRWEAPCGCIHWFESGYETPTDCPDCRAPVVRWDWVE
jgi:hypothetical protein